MCRNAFLLTTLLLVSLVSAKPKPPTADPNAAPIPPKDAQWTLYCQAIAGADHVERANAFKKQLLQSTPLKDWYVIHQEDESILYYGFYRSINDPKDKKESARAQADRKAMDGVLDSQGNKIFAQCMFVEVAAPDPNAPPEWDLRNATGFWSLEIGAYKDSPARKQAAVDAVREARKQGVDAYYFHGPTISSVCIGAWPREAVRPQDEADAVANNPEQDVLVLPQQIAGLNNVEVRNKEGQRVRALAPVTDVVDPSLAAAIAKYPTHALNGEEVINKVQDPLSGQMKDVPAPSLLVQIPRAAPSLLRQSQPPPNLVGPVSPSQTPGAGTLRSVGQ